MHTTCDTGTVLMPFHMVFWIHFFRLITFKDYFENENLKISSVTVRVLVVALTRPARTGLKAALWWAGPLLCPTGTGGTGWAPAPWLTGPDTNFFCLMYAK